MRELGTKAISFGPGGDSTALRPRDGGTPPGEMTSKAPPANSQPWRVVSACCVVSREDSSSNLTLSYRITRKTSFPFPLVFSSNYFHKQYMSVRPHDAAQRVPAGATHGAVSKRDLTLAASCSFHRHRSHTSRMLQ